MSIALWNDSIVIIDIKRVKKIVIILVNACPGKPRQGLQVFIITSILQFSLGVIYGILLQSFIRYQRYESVR